MYILDFTNEFLGNVATGLQFVTFLFLIVYFSLTRKYNAVYVRVYGMLMAYLFCVLAVKCLLIGAHANKSDLWYSPHILSSLALVPMYEGLLYSLYRQGVPLRKICRRIAIGELFYVVVVVCVAILGFPKWLKVITYTYTVVYALWSFILAMVRTSLFNKQIKRAYSNMDQKELFWVRPVLWTIVILFAMCMVSKMFVEVWVRVAYDFISIFFYSVIGYFIMRQQPVNTEMLDDTRMFLSGDMVDNVTVNVYSGNHEMMNAGSQFSKDKLIETGKMLNYTLSSPAVCTDKNFDINKLAEKVGVDSYCLSYYLACELEIDFYTFINDFRLDYAEHLLSSKLGLSDEDVCSRSGFSGMEVMNELFMQRHNCTVPEYHEVMAITMTDIMKPLYEKCEGLYPGFRDRIKDFSDQLTQREEAVLILHLLDYSASRAALYMGTTTDSFRIANVRLRSKLGLLHFDTMDDILEKIRNKA